MRIDCLRKNREWYVRMDLNIDQTFRAMKQQHTPFTQGYTSPPPPISCVPRAIRLFSDAAFLTEFSGKQRLLLRMVFTMVNGQRTR